MRKTGKRKGFQRMFAGLLAGMMVFATLPALPIVAEEGERYPYTIFAASDAEGAITVTASNVCVNGNVCTNGTIVSGGNININGSRTERASEEMIYLFDKMERTYFSGSEAAAYMGDWVQEAINIHVNTPLEVQGNVSLSGNVSIDTAFQAWGNMTLTGEVQNANNAVIVSKYGDIIIDSTNVNINGLVYAPFGDVVITAQNLNLNNVIIIAETVTCDCSNLNANYSSSVAAFVGKETEPFDFPYEEWQYMEDENENGVPDLLEQEETWEKLKDTDGDKIPDMVESCLGIDDLLVDSDGDGLDDLYELLCSYTNPIKADTDDNGVPDGEEDTDGDALNNLQEYALGTVPYMRDSDGDGLSDGEEVTRYETNALMVDTDGDGLEDGDEILLGTNPLVPDSDGDGVRDDEEKLWQTFTQQIYDKECAVTEVIVSMNAAGNIGKTTTIQSMMDIDVLSSNVAGLVGVPFEMETTSVFDEAAIIFRVDQERLGDTAFDNLLVLWYDEENQTYVELETVYDEEESTVSVETTHFSRYMIVDKAAWYEAWAKEYNYNPSDTSDTAPTYYYNTVLAIDCSTSMDSYDRIYTTYVEEKQAYQKTCQRILAAEGFIENMRETDRAAIVTFETLPAIRVNLTNDKEALLAGLQYISSRGGTSFDGAIQIALLEFTSQELNAENTINRIVMLTDGESALSNRFLKEVKAKGIKIDTIGLGPESSDTELKRISDATGGQFYKAYTASELVNLYKTIGMGGDFDATDSDGDGLYDAIEAAGIRLQNGTVICTNPDNADSDGDGLSDGEEIDPTLRQKQLYYAAGDVPPEVIPKQYYFVMKSDPLSEDGDGDGYSDYDEVMIHKSNPLESDVITVELESPYVQVDTSGYPGLEKNSYFGGRQEWFYNENDPQRNDSVSKHIENGGCGVIASCDAILYMQKHTGEALTEVDTSGETIAFEEYEAFVRMYAQEYVTPIDVEKFMALDMPSWVISYLKDIPLDAFFSKLSGSDISARLLVYIYLSASGWAIADLVTGGYGTWGCMPWSVVNGLEQYFADNGQETVCYEHIFDCSRSQAEQLIFGELTRQRPVILLMGLLCETSYKRENGSVGKQKAAHYVNVTKVCKNSITGKTTLIVSSWTEILYIDLENFLDKKGVFGGFIGKEN